jgi:hypothetical protein
MKEYFIEKVCFCSLLCYGFGGKQRKRDSMARGYIGKILWVDLSNHELKDEVLDEKLCHQFIGGYGLASRRPVFNR